MIIEDKKQKGKVFLVNDKTKEPTELCDLSMVDFSPFISRYAEQQKKIIELPKIDFSFSINDNGIFQSIYYSNTKDRVTTFRFRSGKTITIKTLNLQEIINRRTRQWIKYAIRVKSPALRNIQET